jgi:hypothetical protein
MGRFIPFFICLSHDSTLTKSILWRCMVYSSDADHSCIVAQRFGPERRTSVHGPSTTITRFSYMRQYKIDFVQVRVSEMFTFWHIMALNSSQMGKKYVCVGEGGR